MYNVHIRQELPARPDWEANDQVERRGAAPVAPPHVVDKGIPTAGLLAQVLVAKYLDHAPLYRQESIFERAGLALSRSTLAEWVGQAAFDCSLWSRP